MRKRIVVIAVLLLWGAVLFAAYRYFNTINRQKAIDIDNERLYDFSVNDYHIAKFYIDNSRLPLNLAEVEEAAKKDPDSDNIVPPSLVDPETKKEYAYKAVTADEYQICTTFATDTVADKNIIDAYTAYITAQLERYAKSVYHKSGYDCMVLSMAGNPEVAKAKTKTAPSTLPEAFSFVRPKTGDRVCLGSEYTLAWQGDPSTENVGIYLVPPSNLNQSQSWLHNGYTISPGVLISEAEDLNSQKLSGTFNWIVGQLEAYSGKTSQEPVRPGSGYQLGVVTTNSGSQHTYSSDFFEIADCNVASAVTQSSDE